MDQMQADELAAKLAGECATSLNEADDDGKWAVVHCDNGTYVLWDAANGEFDPCEEYEAVWSVTENRNPNGAPTWAVIERHIDGDAYCHVSETACFAFE